MGFLNKAVDQIDLKNVTNNIFYEIKNCTITFESNKNFIKFQFKRVKSFKIFLLT